MEKFPKIKEGQVVLLRADTQTGTILDEHFIWSMNDTQKVYTVFNTVQEALDFAKTILFERNNKVECLIYSENEVLLHYLNPFQEE